MVTTKGQHKKKNYIKADLLGSNCILSWDSPFATIFTRHTPAESDRKSVV